MTKTISLSALLVCGLAACGGGGSSGSGSGGGGIAPTTRDLVGSPTSDFAFNSSANTVTVGSTIVNATTRSTITVPEGFTAFANDNASIVAFRGVTPSGNGATNIYSTGAASTTGAFSERLDDTTLPTSGSVEYRGEYAGIFRGTTSDSIAFTISADARLTADFDDGDINGSISSRIAREADNDTFGMNSVQLQSTALSGGGFEGTTTGGGFLAVGIAGARNGEYSGLIVGSNGEEIVGNVSIAHTINGEVTGQEVGAFIATD